MTFVLPDCTNAEIQSRHDDAGTMNGDILECPAGTFSFTGTVTITKGITLRAATNCVADGVGDATATCSTEIDRNQAGHALLITLAANFTTSVIGIRWDDAGSNPNSVIRCNGPNTTNRRLRVSSNYFNTGETWPVYIFGCTGVIDHNYFNLGGGDIGVYIFHEDWNGGTNSDKSWADTCTFGGENFLFIEHNNFVRATSFYAITDAYRGARYVVRYNRIQNGWVEAHGTDSGGRLRGTRCIEVYENDFTCTTSCSYVINWRSGGGRAWNNRVTGFTSPHFTVAVYRALYTFSPFGQADGENTLDVNDAGSPFYAGTATGGGTGTLTDTGQTFTSITGYLLKKLVTNGVTCVGYCASYITSHTGTEITVSGGGSYPDLEAGTVAASPAATTTTATVTVTSGNISNWNLGNTILVGGLTRTLTARTGTAVTWAPALAGAPANGSVIRLYDIAFVSGDTYEVNKVTHALDQPGRGQGTELSGDPPTGFPQPYDQVTEMIKECNNLQGATDIDITSDHPLIIRNNEHYENDGTPCPDYTPYTYPHPLTGAVAAAATTPAHRIIRRLRSPR